MQIIPSKILREVDFGKDEDQKAGSQHRHLCRHFLGRDPRSKAQNKRGHLFVHRFVLE